MKVACWFPLIIFLVHAVTPAVAETTIDDLKNKVVELGKLSFKRDVPVRYFSQTQLKEYLDKLFENDYPGDQAEREAAFMFMMGFTDKPVSLKPLRKKIILENAGGLYNEKTKELMAIEEYRQIETINSLALVHELRHAVQDQYVDVAALLGDYSDYDDRRLAALAAIEGDASLVMIKYFGFDPEVIASAFDSETLLSFSNVPGVGSLLSAPEIIRYQLLMPYLDGLRFSAAVFAKKGHDGLNRVLRLPPQSSEQILHPEKYLNHEKPEPVQIDYRPPELAPYHDGVVGEYYLNVLLKSGSGVGDPASGWGGDHFWIFRDPTSWVLLWESSWDSDAEAARFYADFRRFLENRFGLNFEEGRTGQATFLAAQSARAAAGYFFLRRQGKGLFFLRTNDRQQINTFISGGHYD